MSGSSEPLPFLSHTTKTKLYDPATPKTRPRPFASPRYDLALSHPLILLPTKLLLAHHHVCNIPPTCYFIRANVPKLIAL
jgi:hypothetical protein